jgi:hypothetical protein
MVGRAVDQHPQHREQAWRELHFVDHDRPGTGSTLQRAKRRQGLGQALQIDRVLEIEPARAVACHQAGGQCALATLARAGEHHGAGSAECALHIGFQASTLEQHAIIVLQSP